MDSCGDNSDDKGVTTERPDQTTRGSHHAPGRWINLSAGQIRKLHTGCLMFTFLAFGLNLGAASTSIVDIQALLHATLFMLTTTTAVGNVGNIVASFVGGHLSNKYRQYTDLVTGICIVVEGVLTIFLFWSDLVVLFILSIVRSVAHGIGFTMVIPALISDWGKTSGTALNALQMSLAVGLMLGPILTAPFLTATSTPLPNTTITNVTVPYGIDDVAPAHIPTTYGQYPIFTLYTIIGVLMILPGVMFIIIFCCGCRHQTPNRTTNRPTAGISSNHKKKLYIIMTISVLLFYFCVATRDGLLLGFTYYIAVEGSLHMSKSQAAILNTFNYASCVFGRMLGTVLVKKTGTRILSLCITSLALALNILLYFYGLHSALSLWILICLFQLFAAPCYASVLAWIDCYVEVDGFLMATVEFGNASGISVSLFIGGAGLQYFGATSIFAITIGASSLLFCLCVIFHFASFKRHTRFQEINVSVREISDEPVGENTPLLNSARHSKKQDSCSTDSTVQTSTENTHVSDSSKQTIAETTPLLLSLK